MIGDLLNSNEKISEEEDSFGNFNEVKNKLTKEEELINLDGLMNF